MLLPLFLLAGCGEGGTTGGEEGAGVADSVYVEVMARLVLLDSVMTPPSRHPEADVPHDSLRARILRRWNVSGDQLLEYARLRGSEPEGMQRIWLRIRELSDSLDTAGWTPVPTATDTAAPAPGPEADSGDPAGSEGP